MDLSVTKRTNQTTLSLAQIKLFIKVDYNDDDELINRLVFAAFDYFEAMTGIVLYEKEYQLYGSDVERNYTIPRMPINEVTELHINGYEKDVESFTKGITRKAIVCNEGDTIEVAFKAGSRTFDDKYFNIISEMVAFWYENRQSEALPQGLQMKLIQMQVL
jgi:hypothetical protein